MTLERPAQRHARGRSGPASTRRWARSRAGHRRCRQGTAQRQHELSVDVRTLARFRRPSPHSMPRLAQRAPARSAATRWLRRTWALVVAGQMRFLTRETCARGLASLRRPFAGRVERCRAHDAGSAAAQRVDAGERQRRARARQRDESTRASDGAKRLAAIAENRVTVYLPCRWSAKA